VVAVLGLFPEMNAGTMKMKFMSDLPNRDVDFFAEALQKPSGERGAYLERACAGESALRHRVDALLQAHKRVRVSTSALVSACAASMGRLYLEHSSFKGPKKHAICGLDPFRRPSHCCGDQAPWRA
jgi:hypothetical protein